MTIEYLYEAGDEPTEFPWIEAECHNCSHVYACHLPPPADCEVNFDEGEIDNWAIHDDKTIMICRVWPKMASAHLLIAQGPCVLRGCDCPGFQS